MAVKSAQRENEVQFEVPSRHPCLPTPDKKLEAEQRCFLFQWSCLLSLIVCWFVWHFTARFGMVSCLLMDLWSWYRDCSLPLLAG